MTCLFCKIAQGEIPAKIIYQDEQVIAFYDIKPQAPIHCLIIPRLHIATLNEISTHDPALAGKLLQTTSQLAQELNIADAGYRVIANCNAAGGQEVYHLHLHLLGGRQMHWPPG